MPEEKKVVQAILEPSREFVANARIKKDEYEKLCQLAKENPEEFWKKFLNEIDWFKKPTKILNETNAPFYKWFEDGTLNVSYNCLDRHLNTKATKSAIIWEGEDGQMRDLTYGELYLKVSKFANALKSLGVKKGDRVYLYLPMIPELPIAMLACARIGAIHSVVFGALSDESLQYRINEAEAKVLITVDGYWRAGKIVDAFGKASKALKGCPTIEHVIVVERLGGKIKLPKEDSRYYFWHEVIKNQKDYCEPEEMNAEDTLFLLYTSGSTGKPKGVIHTSGGYLLYTHLTYKWIFDYKEKDVFWCTADIGWITGHSYIVYGPLSNGATVFMYEAVPQYPHPGRYWELIDKYRVTVLYTAPTAISGVRQFGDEWPAKYRLDSLRLLGSVGEPIKSDDWLWYWEHIGHCLCPIVDTWWQTETGGILKTTLPGVHSMKPGSAGFPLPGIVPEVIQHKETDLYDDTPDLNRPHCPVGVMGKLIITRPWPGMLRGLWKNPERFKKTYYKQFGLYLSGDGVVREGRHWLKGKIDYILFKLEVLARWPIRKGGAIDSTIHKVANAVRSFLCAEGIIRYWLKGRIDDIILFKGHNISTAETESALVSHPAVAEAALAYYPEELGTRKALYLYVFVTPKAEVKPTEDLKKELVAHVRNKVDKTYTIEIIQFVEALPKTRSGKIMRRILQKVVEGETKNFDNISTLDNPEIIPKLIEGRIEG